MKSLLTTGRTARMMGVIFGVLLALGLGYSVVRSRQPVATPAAPALAVPENEAGKAGDLNVREEALELAEIRSAPAVLRTVRETLQVTGKIETGGNQVARVSPRVAGKVVRLLALPGDRVRTGQPLAVLESAELSQAQAAYLQAAARSRALESNLQRQQELARLGQFGKPHLEQSQTQAVESERTVHEALHRLKEERAGLALSEAERDVLRVNLQRSRDLKELVSQQQLQRLEADLKKGEAEVQAAQARVEGAEGDLALARSRLQIARSARQREEKVFSGRYLTSRELVEAESALELARAELEGAAERVRLLGGTAGGGGEVTLVSPIAGKVQECAITLGETVGADRAAYTVVDLSQVWAVLAVPPRELPRLQVGDPVELVSDSAPSTVFRGRLEHISTASDETTRAIYVRAKLANREGALKAGAFVTGQIITDVRRQKLTVPLTALQEHSGRPTLYVTVPGKPGAFEVRHVLLGAQGKDWREIKDGLKPGESTAVSGTFYLKSEALKSSLSDGCCGGD